MYNVQCSMYNVHCTMYIVHCTLYSVHCTMFNVLESRYNIWLYVLFPRIYCFFLKEDPKYTESLNTLNP